MDYFDREVDKYVVLSNCKEAYAQQSESVSYKKF